VFEKGAEVMKTEVHAADLAEGQSLHMPARRVAMPISAIRVSNRSAQTPPPVHLPSILACDPHEDTDKQSKAFHLLVE